jgi:UDP-GlcNAc:undecaprenyl-phosphate GlcNAc-1-phosphate transferase
VRRRGSREQDAEFVDHDRCSRWRSALMQLDGWDYGAVFAVTLSLALVLTPTALRLAIRRQILDHPNEIKGQAVAVPYLGGLAIVVSFVAVVVAAVILRPPVSGRVEILAVLGAATLLSSMGLADDLRGLSPWLRLGIEIAAGIVVWQMDFGAALFHEQLLDGVLTVVWVVGVTNALNLLDNMDGLSAGVACIASLWFFVIAAANGQFLVATLAIALTGCAAGFLRSNFHPARIYMGDAGSLFLGFMLAVIGIRLRFDGSAGVTFWVPILVLGTPLFDTTLVTVNRLLHGRNPMSGGRDHLSHRLVFVGIPVPAAVSLIYAGAASLGCLGFVMADIDRGPAYVLVGWVLSVAAVLGVLASLVPVYETSRRRHLMIREVRGREEAPPEEAAS